MDNLPPVSLSPKTNSLAKSRRSDPAQALFAAERAKILFGCYRRGDANDPETYTAAITAILAEYPEEVIQHVTDPRTGIARRTNWLPTVAEIDMACIASADFIEKRDQLIRKGWRFEDGNWIKPEGARANG